MLRNTVTTTAEEVRHNLGGLEGIDAGIRKLIAKLEQISGCETLDVADIAGFVHGRSPHFTLHESCYITEKTTEYLRSSYLLFGCGHRFTESKILQKFYSADSHQAATRIAGVPRDML
jgi:hypothetical protein